MNISLPSGSPLDLTARSLPVPHRWCLHSYYSLCPYAPDASGRILAAGADLETGRGEVLILSPDGVVLQRFASVPVTTSFWHTGLWQSWSPDARFIYYQGGSLESPSVVRHDLDTGAELIIKGDIEGFPPSGEPAYACPHGMLYAAGYGDNRYKPEASPIPFQDRRRHGISRITFSPPEAELVLSTEEILERHPLRDRILAADRQMKERHGPKDGLTLMTYCVRWNRAGDRFLFFFGNHCVAKDRGEPKITSVFTADRSLRDIRLAVDLSFGRKGVHWSWQADNERLIGYGPHPKDPARSCLAEVNADGTGYRMLSEHRSGGHPSTSPRDPDLIVTDEAVPGGGAVVFLSRKTGGEIDRVNLPKFHGATQEPGRHPRQLCHHPVFDLAGENVLCNSLPGPHAELVEIHLAS